MSIFLINISQGRRIKGEIEYISGKIPTNTKILLFDCDGTVTNGKEELAAEVIRNVFAQREVSTEALDKIVDDF